MTDDICAVCYVNDDLVTPNETPVKLLSQSADVASRVASNCVKPPCSTAHTNIRRANEQANATKKRQHAGTVDVGRRKARAS